MRLQLLIPPLVVISLLGTSSHAAEIGRVELHVIQTTTLTDEQFLAGRRGQRTTIAAELRLPRATTERFPAVVLVHGSGGPNGITDRWSQELNDMGIATFLIDSFASRGITATAFDQSQLGRLTMINDAYRALDLLAKHPRIDAARIGIMGGSRGGTVALYASLKRFQRMYASPGTEFAVYLPFYAGCFRTYIGDTDVADRPIRLFHGTADDTALIEHCRSYVERLRSAGKDVELKEYVGAHHGFDWPDTPLTRDPRVQVDGACVLYENPAGRMINRDTQRPFTWADACIKRGGTVAYDADVHAEAIKDVRDVLEQVFGLDSSQ
jgi:dienelactone hydrolase